MGKKWKALGMKTETHSRAEGTVRFTRLRRLSIASTMERSVFCRVARQALHQVLLQVQPLAPHLVLSQTSHQRSAKTVSHSTAQSFTKLPAKPAEIASRPTNGHAPRNACPIHSERQCHGSATLLMF